VSDPTAAALAALNQTLKKLTEEVAGLSNDMRVLETTLDRAVKRMVPDRSGGRG
jgi:hypothetical protein